MARKVDDQETIAVFVPRGMVGDKNILAGNKRRLTRAELHRKAGPHIRAILAETCSWTGDEPPGDHRFVTFAVHPTENTEVFVQFWSEPNDVVVWEVTSGEFHDDTAAWLPKDLAARLKPFGLRLPSNRGPDPEPENYSRTVTIKTARDLTRVARAVVDIFHEVFAYRGLTPIQVHLNSGGAASYDAVYQTVSTDIICKIAKRAGCATTVADEDAAPGTSLIHVTRRGVSADVVLADDKGDGWYASGFLGTTSVPRAARAGAQKAVTAELPAIQPDDWRVGVTLYFDGGVTADWIANRIAYGLSLIGRSSGTRSGARSARRRRAPRPSR